MSESAASFAAVEAIEAGEWDRFLGAIWLAVRNRRMILDLSREPKLPKPEGTIWVQMNGPGSPHWEIRGMGALLEPEAEAEHRARRDRLRREAES